MVTTSCSKTKDDSTFGEVIISINGRISSRKIPCFKDVEIDAKSRWTNSWILPSPPSEERQRMTSCFVLSSAWRRSLPVAKKCPRSEPSGRLRPFRTLVFQEASSLGESTLLCLRPVERCGSFGWEWRYRQFLNEQEP